MLGEGVPQHAHDGIVFQALEGGDLGAVARHGVGDAGARGRAVDQHGAGAAHAVLAADVGAGEELVLAQEIGEVQSRLDIRPHLASVDGKGNGSHDAHACRAARLSATGARWRI